MTPSIQNEEDRLLNYAKRPRKHKPSNAALWFAAIFFNGVALVLDIISAATVYRLTGGLWLYAVLTFLAGFLPMMLMEFLFLRAYASDMQRKIAIVGAVAAIVSVVGIGILSGIANAKQIGEVEWASQVVLVILVLVASFHGLLSAFYFYSDPGIRAQHTEAETMAYHNERLKNMRRAQEILQGLKTTQQLEAEIIGKFGSRAAYDEIMRQLTGDDDNDGVPNFKDPDWKGLQQNKMPPSGQAMPLFRESGETENSFPPRPLK